MTRGVCVQLFSIGTCAAIIDRIDDPRSLIYLECWNQEKKLGEKKTKKVSSHHFVENSFYPKISPAK